MTRTRKTTMSDTAACEKCGGTGYMVNDDSARPCDCLKSRELLLSYRHANIPRKFLNKTLSGYSTKNQKHKEILAFARSFLKTFKGNHHDHPGKGLLLTGKEGTGKTHIAIAIAKEVIEKGYTGLYWNVPDLFLELRRRMNAGEAESEADLFDAARRVDLLVMDDLGAEKTSDYVLDRLYVLINGRYENDRATVITTNRSPSELKQQVGARIASRLSEMCVLVEFPEGDFRLQNLK